jgi:hypothetical protein
MTAADPTPAGQGTRNYPLPASGHITIDFDLNQLPGYTDEFLATLWQVAQANPAPHGDYHAGEIASKVGVEIIRRWLKAAPAEMYHHQQRDNYWQALRQLATYEPPAGADVMDPAWHDGRWVLKDQSREPQS